MSSSFRKVAPRPEHKERGQPSHRSRLGLLEKHKDYALRAKNFHGKEKRILALKEKARLKNPDEFYFGMNSTKTKDGIHKAERGETFTPEMLQVLKSQDLSYVTTQRNISKKKMNRLKDAHPELSLSLNEAPAKSEHVLFKGIGPMEETLVPVKVKRTPGILHGKSTLKTNQREKLAIAREIESREKRDQALKKVEKELKNQRLLSEKGRKKKIGTGKDGVSVYKWNHERKK